MRQLEHKSTLTHMTFNDALHNSKSDQHNEIAQSDPDFKWGVDIKPSMRAKSRENMRALQVSRAGQSRIPNIAINVFNGIIMLGELNNPQ